MSKSYCVYEHVFPNGKRYIGITCDVEKRWRNGKGYETQGKIANAIRCYGWENVKHNIIIDGISKEQAEKLERYLIAELDTIVNGYNTTIGGENILSSYLNSHVLAMLRESEMMDNKYGCWEGYEPNDDDIVHFVEKAKYNKEMADIINAADELLERHEFFSSYKSSFTDKRVDEYFWYLIQFVYVLLGIKTEKEIIKYETMMYKIIFGNNSN